MKSFDSSRADFAPYGLTCERWTHVAMPRADRHNEIELNLLLEGSLIYLLGGERVTIEAGTLAAFWAAIPHQILPQEKLGLSAEYFVVTIPLAWFLQLQLPKNFVEPILHGDVVMDHDREQFAEDVKQFGRWANEVSGPSNDLQRASFLEIQARLLRLGCRTRLSSDRTPSESSLRTPFSSTNELGKAEQMARFIAQNYTSSLTVDDISQAVSLHPGYAMTLFRKAFGMSLVTCINQHRLTHAKRLLTTTNDQILAIAFESGFGSLSRFNDAFRRTIGCTPRQFRIQHRTEFSKPIR